MRNELLGSVSCHVVDQFAVACSEVKTTSLASRAADWVRFWLSPQIFFLLELYQCLKKWYSRNLPGACC